MALPDINIEQFLDLVEGSKIYPHDNGADIEEKNRKLDMLREQAAAKPFLLNKIGTSSSRHSRKTTPLMLAFDKNNGRAARVLLEAGADMRQNFVWDSYREEKKRNAFDAFLDDQHSGYDAVNVYNYPHGSSKVPDEILPIITEYLESLPPEERRKMFERATDGKYYVTSLASTWKWPLHDKNGDEQPSAFERLSKLGATFDVIPPEDRATALAEVLQTNTYKGGARYFQFLKEHIHSLEGGDDLWRSMFAPGQLSSIMNSIRSSRIRNSDEHPKKTIENAYTLFRSMLDEVPDSDLGTLFADKVEGNYRHGNRPVAPLVSHIITNRHYGAAKDFSSYLAARLTTYFENIYPTLPEEEKLAVDRTCREMFGGFYDCRYANRENNPVYQLLRKQVEEQLAQNTITDEKYGKPKPRNLPELIVQYSGSYDSAAANVQEMLTELHRHHFYPNKTVLKPEERDHILDEVAKWDKDLPKPIRGNETQNLIMQVCRDYDCKLVTMNAEELAAKRAKDKKLRSELKERNAPYRNGYQALCNEKNIQFIIDHMGGEDHARNRVSFAEAVSFFNEIGFYLGKVDYDLEPLAQKCFEDVVLHAEKNNTSLTEALDFFKTHYPRQEIINVKDTLNEISRYIYQPAYVIRARKAGLSETEISKTLQENSGNDYTIRQSFLDGLSFHEVLDNSIYWHMRRAGVIGPAPKDAETGEPITDAVRKHALQVGWNPLFKGDVDFQVGSKQYRLSGAITSQELQRYGSYCRTCVGGEGFSMDCMAGRQQVYGLFEIDADTGKASQKGYVRMRVTRSADPKAFERQIESQENADDATIAKRFSDGVGIALNRRTAIQYDYITGFGNQTPPWLQKIFEQGLKEFGRVAIQKGRDGRLTLPQKEKDTEEDTVLATPEEILGLDHINHAESLRIFKLLEKTAAGLDRNEKGYAIDADTGEEIKNLEGLYEGDRKVRIDEDASLFKHFRANRHTIPGHSKMDGLQQFMVVTGLDKSIDNTIEWYKKHKAEKEAKGETEQQHRYGTVANVSFDAVERHVPNVQDQYYDDIREMQGVINRKLKSHRNRGTEIPQIFGNISSSDVLEAVRAFAEAYPEEVKIQAKPYAPDETKICVRKSGWQDTNLNIILSHIIAKRGISVPFLEWKTGKDIEFMSEDTRWLKDCKPLSDFDGVESFVAKHISEAPGMTAFQADGENKTLFALRPSAMEDMELAVKFSQNSKTFPALIWGIPSQAEPIDERTWRGNSRPQWLVTPQFQKELETLGAANFHLIEPPERVQVKSSPIKIGEDRTLAFERRA